MTISNLTKKPSSTAAPVATPPAAAAKKKPRFGIALFNDAESGMVSRGGLHITWIVRKPDPVEMKQAIRRAGDHELADNDDNWLALYSCRNKTDASGNLIFQNTHAVPDLSTQQLQTLLKPRSHDFGDGKGEQPQWSGVLPGMFVNVRDPRHETDSTLAGFLNLEPTNWQSEAAEATARSVSAAGQASSNDEETAITGGTGAEPLPQRNVDEEIPF